MTNTRISGAALAGLAAALLSSLPAFARKDAVHVKGYINVTSHCQDPLIAVLKDLDKKYGKEMTLEIIDFGSPAGKKRWIDDGYRCLTLLIDGKTEAMVERNGSAKQVSFKMPPGLMWVMDDLKQALAERVAALPAKRAKTPVTSRNAGATGEVLIGKKVVIRYNSASGGKSASERAKLSAERVKKLYLDSLTPSEVQPGKRNGMWVVVARGQSLATATKPEADASKTTPKKLAISWAKNIKAALTAK